MQSFFTRCRMLHKGFFTNFHLSYWHCKVIIQHLNNVNTSCYVFVKGNVENNQLNFAGIKVSYVSQK